MKKLIQYMLRIIQKYIFKYEFYEWLSQKKDLLRSYWLKSYFLYCGDNVLFQGVKKICGSNLISIGSGTHFGCDLFLTVWKTDHRENSSINDLNKNNSVFISGIQPQIKIGEGCNFGAYNHITCINKIIIGHGVLTGKWVTITDNSHGSMNYESLLIQPLIRDVVSKGSVVIGNNVWIGDKVTILPGVTIGDNAVIAANSVVTKDIPSFSVAAGIPAVILKNVRDGSI